MSGFSKTFSNYLKLKYFLSLIFGLFLICSCATVTQMDDAIRIKPEAAKAKPDIYGITKSNGKPRNESALRGTVLKVDKLTFPDSCVQNTTFSSRYIVEFLDWQTSDLDFVEKIPIEDIDLIGPKIPGILKNRYGNINIFERFNDPLNPKTIREAQVDSIYIDTCKAGCDCYKFNLPDPSLTFSIECPYRSLSWYFLELRAGYSIYDDLQSSSKSINRQAWSGEIDAGYRFGNHKQWGIGMAFGSGVPAFNSFNGADFMRPFAMLHLRYQFGNPDFSIRENKMLNDTCKTCEKIIVTDENSFFQTCIRPFLFAQLGASIDNLSVKLFDVNFCKECKSTFDLNGKPNVDMGIPISYTLGAGIDLAVPGLPFLDLSADIAFRSLAFGQLINTDDYLNVPTKRRLNMLLFRFGITF